MTQSKCKQFTSSALRECNPLSTHLTSLKNMLLLASIEKITRVITFIDAFLNGTASHSSMKNEMHVIIIISLLSKIIAWETRDNLS